MDKRTMVVGSFATAILMLTCGFAVPASASAVSPASITASVMYSSDPRAAFLALSAPDRAMFLDAFEHQNSVTVVSRGGSYTPTANERATMTTTATPAALAATAKTVSSGCWYHYWYKSWSDLGIHDGDSWLQLNWCASGGRITSWSQTNYGCAGHHGASCSVQGRADLNVGWEVRSSRYYKADFFGFSNTFCMQIRGGATGLYSQNSSASSGCPLS
jgi:hypothetical protein